MSDGSPPPPGGAGDGRIDERIAERRRGVRREQQLGRRRRTVTVVGIVLFAVAFWAIERSDLVGLESIEVTGTDRLTEAEVLEAAELELGTSTLRLGLASVEERVTQLPLVRDTTARRLDPLTVRIEVIERVPVLVARGGGEEVLVDRTGVVIATGAVGGLPVVALPEAPPEEGERAADSAPLGQAVRTWQQLSGPLRTEVVTYDARRSEDLDLQLRSGVTVRFGRADRIDEKVRALGVVLEDLESTEVTSVDVRAPARPVVIP